MIDRATFDGTKLEESGDGTWEQSFNGQGTVTYRECRNQYQVDIRWTLVNPTLPITRSLDESYSSLDAAKEAAWNIVEELEREQERRLASMDARNDLDF
jgi:hypothetical protein